MPGSDQRTRVSPNRRRARDVLVVEFRSPPHYRNNDVDTAADFPVEFFGETTLGGNAVEGLRLIVAHTTQQTGKCKVLVAKGSYKVRATKDNEEISVGIEEV